MSQKACCFLSLSPPPPPAAAARSAIFNSCIICPIFAAAAGEQTVTLDPFSGAVPDLTGLTITGVFSAVPTDVYVWGYTASFDLVTADNIKTRLLEFAGDGMPLDGIAAPTGRRGQAGAADGRYSVRKPPLWCAHSLA